MNSETHLIAGSMYSFQLCAGSLGSPGTFQRMSALVTTIMEPRKSAKTWRNTARMFIDCSKEGKGGAKLGRMPYWEIRPFQNGTRVRFAIDVYSTRKRQIMAQRKEQSSNHLSENVYAQYVFQIA